jgi:hypothetical protein
MIGNKQFINLMASYVNVLNHCVERACRELRSTPGGAAQNAQGHSFPEYWLLVTVCVAGTVGLSGWWTVPVGVAGLSISAPPK